MKRLLVLFLIIGAVMAAEFLRGRPEWDDDWEQFKGKHRKSYKDKTEEGKRRANWEARRAEIVVHNKEADEGKHSWRSEENHFTDWADGELALLKSYKHCTKCISNIRSRELPTVRQNPSSLDLRNHSCMPAVKNQGSCGSCWAFAATTPVEFQNCRITGTLKTFSEQQIVDCSKTSPNNGCNGGNPYVAWMDLIKDGGQATSAAYPYTGTAGTCKFTSSKAVGKLTSGTFVSSPTISQMETTLVASGPVSGLMMVINSFFSYSSGVYDDAACPNNSVNHVIVFVGYGNTNGTPYWIVRNSWGASWGAKGYFLIRKGVNRCGIELYLATLVV